ncbi:MAG: phosphate ABC transporter ATP-binding protein [Candidatus Auribacterota bacterium]
MNTKAFDTNNTYIEVQNVDFFYGKKQILFNNCLTHRKNSILALIGPAGAGKSTHLRLYNRLFDLHKDRHAQGTVYIDGINILDQKYDLIKLRKNVGMIFRQPTPFPMSIFENIAYGIRLHYKLTKSTLAERVRVALETVLLWNEVKDRLNGHAYKLTPAQQQLLCIARSIAIDPELILMDEPTAEIDAISAGKLEDLIGTLKKKYTIIIVPQNLQQAARVSDFSIFFNGGRIVEAVPTNQLFTNPTNKQTEDYITGRSV